jgi:hypothetical protein
VVGDQGLRIGVIKGALTKGKSKGVVMKPRQTLTWIRDGSVSWTPPEWD